MMRFVIKFIPGTFPNQEVIFFYERIKVDHPWRVSFNTYADGTSSNFLRNTLNKIYMAVFDKNTGLYKREKRSRLNQKQ